VASRRSAGCIASIVVLAALSAFLAPSALAAAPLTTPDGLWTWVRPLPFGYQANAIAAPAPGTLFVGTTARDALVTHDSGASWSWSHTNVRPGLFIGGISSIAFPSPQQGWAGAEGVLLHTADGGLTWQTQISRPGLLQFDLLSFSDATSGWAVAQDGDYTELYATNNGGQTWTQAMLPGENTTFTTLAAQGPGQALLVQEQWQSGIGNGEDYGIRLYRTTDYGAHWSVSASLSKYFEFSGATFVTSTRGWALIAGSLWQTIDGGLRWQKLSDISRDHRFGRILSVGSDVWVVGSDHILHSPNAGKSWQTLPGMTLDYPSAVSFSNGRDGWVTTGSAYLHTTDGGKSWHRVISRPIRGVTELTPASSTTVWGAAGYLIRSSDGGAHWQRVTQRSSLSAVAAIGSRQAWAVGAKGLIIHTVDGGRHWTRQTGGTAADLADVCFVDARHGWIGRSKGSILRTVDGGRHWATNHTPVGGSIFKVVFADARRGVALTTPAKPYLLLTDNGGRSWKKTTFSTTNFKAVDISMKDATHWLVISSLGHSWTTSDGGRTWQQGADLPQPFGDYVDVARSGSLLCAIDWGGDLATSANDGASWSFDNQLKGVVSCAQFVGDHRLLVGGGAGILARDLSATPLR
jgi:photosystem II stability/assembly factor-like uncharacterized protein